MRAINIAEQHSVCGSFGEGNVGSAASLGGVLGGFAGISYASAAGSTAAAAIGFAGIGGIIGSGLFAAATMGWNTGIWLNENTGIQGAVANGLTKLLGEPGGTSSSGASNSSNSCPRTFLRPDEDSLGFSRL